MPIFNIGMGILIAGGILILAWYSISGPWVVIDSQALSFKSSWSKRVQIPLKFIAGTRTRVSLAGFHRMLQILINDMDGYLATLPEEERKFDSREVKKDGFVTLSLYDQRVLPQELQPEIRKRIDAWQASQNPAVKSPSGGQDGI